MPPPFLQVLRIRALDQRVVDAAIREEQDAAFEASLQEDRRKAQPTVRNSAHPLAMLRPARLGTI